MGQSVPHLDNEPMLQRMRYLVAGKQDMPVPMQLPAPRDSGIRGLGTAATHAALSECGTRPVDVHSEHVADGVVLTLDC